MNKMVSLEIFNQDQAIKLGLNLEDLVIIKYIIDKSDTVKRIYIKENNEIIYYFEYRDIISYLPIIFNKQSINLNIDYLKYKFNGSISNVLISKYDIEGVYIKINTQILQWSMIRTVPKIILSQR